MPLAVIGTTALCVASWVGVHATRTLIASLTKTVDQLDSTLAAVDKTLRGTHKNGDDGMLFRTSMLIENADTAANAIKQTAQTVNKVTKANQPSTEKVSAASLDTIRAGQNALVNFGTAIDTLNGTIIEVRDVTLPKVNAGVDSLNLVVAGLRPVEDNAATLLASGNEATLGLKSSVAVANALLGDKDITDSIKNMSLFSSNMSSFSKHLDTSMDYIEMDLSPKHIPFWQTLLEGAMGNVIGIPFKRISQKVSITK